MAKGSYDQVRAAILKARKLSGCAYEVEMPNGRVCRIDLPIKAAAPRYSALTIEESKGKAEQNLSCHYGDKALPRTPI